ncbi:MAG: S8/S53 family peptidase [Bacteroidia bacterium]
MKKIITSAGISLCLFFATSVSAQTAKKAVAATTPKVFVMNKKFVEGVDYVKGDIIFAVKDQYRGQCSAGLVNDPKITQVLNFLGVIKFGKIYPNHQPPKEKRNAMGQEYADLSLIYDLKFSNTNITLEKAINLMLSTGMLEYAQPRYQSKHCSIFPNDPNANGTTKLQYNYLNHIKAYNAWDTVASNLVGPKGRGDTNVVIGIVDSGTDLAHPDLMNQFKHNYADPIDGIDNDGDTYIDNFTGWDLAGSDYNNIVGDNSPQVMGANNEHGSHVSGCASAQTNNGIGVAGVAWNCKLLPVKCAADNDTRGSGGEGYIITGYEGITYAADHGAKVINCSWGGTGASSYEQTVVTYASVNKGAVVVCAAGNDGLDEAFFPASLTYVLSVAASNANSDAKASFSNYNYSVDIMSPGNGIYNTVCTGPTSHSYTSMSGTSMASPITAGGVALVLAKWPSYSGLQAAQRLIVTADNVYSQNASYLNKLGSGRTNLYRALTDAATPSIVWTNYSTVDHNDLAFTQGDTLFIAGDFVNYLAPTSSAATASISISSGGGTFITGLNTSYPLGVMATGSTKNNGATPFTFKLGGLPPLNNVITFLVKVTDGTYTQSYWFTVLLNPDYVNVAINDVATTITSHGRVGWNQDGELQGLGFSYQGTQLLYEGGLMIGKSSSAVSDCVRGTTAGVGDTDFGGSVLVAQKVGPTVSDFDVITKFNDNTASPVIGVTVHQNAYAWTSAGSRKFVICEYIIKNTNSTALTNIYPGIFCDWDIDASTASANKANYDATRKLGYSYSPAASGLYAGVQVLTNSAAPNCYSIDNTGTGRGGVNLSSVFSTADKYTTLSTQRLTAGDSSLSSYPGNDVCQVVSSGPFTIAAGDSIKVAFALLAGDNLTDLQQSADTAFIRYNHLTGIKANAPIEQNFAVYPNPATNEVNFVFGSTQSKGYTISLVNTLGQTVKVTSLIAPGNSQQKVTFDVSDLSEGTYIYKVNSTLNGTNGASEQPKVGKIVVRH